MSDRDYMRRDWDEQNRPRFFQSYPGTKGVIVALVAIHLLLEILRATSLDAWVSVQNTLRLHPEFVFRKFHIWQLFTAGLLHGDTWHLFWNCIAFWYIGRLVEHRLNLRQYLWFILGATVTASIFYLFWAIMRDDVTPMLGASAAGQALVVLAALWWPRMTLMVFGLFPVALWMFAIVLVLGDVFSALRGPGGIAHTAHLGGALYGFLYFRHASRMSGVFGAIDRYAEKKRRKKERKVRRKELEMREELDRILDKVNREGMTALSSAERKFLKETSDRLRE